MKVVESIAESLAILVKRMELQEEVMLRICRQNDHIISIIDTPHGEMVFNGTIKVDKKKIEAALIDAQGMGMDLLRLDVQFGNAVYLKASAKNSERFKNLLSDAAYAKALRMSDVAETLTDLVDTSKKELNRVKKVVSDAEGEIAAWEDRLSSSELLDKADQIDKFLSKSSKMASMAEEKLKKVDKVLGGVKNRITSSSSAKSCSAKNRIT